MGASNLHTPFSTPALKVCGMRDPENIRAVAAIKPNYMGFIFWEPSKRFIQNPIPEIDPNIQKIGVFVKAIPNFILKTIQENDLQGVQLHGGETAQDCKVLRDALDKEVGLSKPSLVIIKAFSVADQFDFSSLAAYEAYCDYFLFDTKGKLPGGNGYTFSWKLLSAYPSNTPYFLSGGIGLRQTDALAEFLESDAAKMCAVIDVNSTFEEEDYTKNYKDLELFNTALKKRFLPLKNTL